MIQLPNLYIFRHGLTKAVKRNEHYGPGNLEIQILPEAAQPIKKMAEYLKNMPSDQRFTSPFLRCLETAEIVARIIGKDFITDSRLGDFIEQPDLPPGQELEAFDLLQKRIADFKQDLLKQEYKDVFICTHGGIIAALKDIATIGEVKEENLFNFPVPGILTIIKNGKIEEIDFN